MNIFTSDECVICLDSAPYYIFAPCGHSCCCAKCGQEVEDAKMPCPLCMSQIERMLNYLLEDDKMEPAPVEQVSAFKEKERTEYLKRMRVVHTMSKSKFCRSVSAAIGNELEQRRKETQGGERCMAKSVEFKVVADFTLLVTYKVGRRQVKESYALMELDAIRREMQTTDPDDLPSCALDMATYYPEYYWNIAYHTDRKVAAFMEECGVVKKRRK